MHEILILRINLALHSFYLKHIVLTLVVISFINFTSFFLLFLNFLLLIDEESVKEQLLPGLKLLQRDADHMEAAYKSMISTMITEFEATIIKSDNVPGNKQPVQTAPGVGSGFGSFFTGVRGGVADIKNKGRENSGKSS